MKSKLQKVTRMALALCMAALLFCNAVTDAQAASYEKSFTKTVTIEGGQCMMTMKLKKDAAVTVAVSTTSKNKNLNIQAIIVGANVPAKKNGSYFTELNPEKKKGSFTVNVEKGTRYLYVSNYATGKVKVKVKVSTKSKVLKYIKKEMIEDVG